MTGVFVGEGNAHVLPIYPDWALLWRYMWWHKLAASDTEEKLDCVWKPRARPEKGDRKETCLRWTRWKHKTCTWIDRIRGFLYLYVQWVEQSHRDQCTNQSQINKHRNRDSRVNVAWKSWMSLENRECRECHLRHLTTTTYQKLEGFTKKSSQFSAWHVKGFAATVVKCARTENLWNSSS